MQDRNRSRTGFTLVEVLMVAIILAILAVIVVPQFTDASEDVKISSLKATLQTVRSQLELYKAQHGGQYPPADSLIDCMTQKSSLLHAVTGDPADLKYGPYLQQAPVNPVDDKTTVGNAQDGSGGWWYNPDSGVFKANDTSVTGVSKTKDL